MSSEEDLKAENRLRDLIVAEYVLSQMENRKKFNPVTVDIKDIQAVLRLLDTARRNTKSKKP